MMPLFVCLIGASVPLSANGDKESSPSTTLTVYCYDSFISEWGPGPRIVESFTAQTGIHVSLHAPGDAITVLNQLVLEKAAPRADVVIGLDDSLLSTAIDEGILKPYESPSLVNVSEELIFDSSYHLLPYDYGHYAINCDTLALEMPPDSLEALTDPQYRNQLILIDPRTSTPGLGFLLWTVSVYGHDWPTYWQRLKPSILTIADSWSQAYALYIAGEASMVLSYGTSPVYHAEYEKSDRYRALEFDDGHIMQVEGMGIVNGTNSRDSAEALIDFMLGVEAQHILALSNIMLPVRRDIVLPPSFEQALRPRNILNPDAEGNQDENTQLIDRWIEVFAH